MACTNSWLASYFRRPSSVSIWRRSVQRSLATKAGSLATGGGSIHGVQGLRWVRLGGGRAERGPSKRASDMRRAWDRVAQSVAEIARTWLVARPRSSPPGPLAAWQRLQRSELLRARHNPAGFRRGLVRARPAADCKSWLRHATWCRWYGSWSSNSLLVVMPPPAQALLLRAQHAPPARARRLLARWLRDGWATMARPRRAPIEGLRDGRATLAGGRGAAALPRLSAPSRGRHRWRAAPDGRRDAGGGGVRPVLERRGRHRRRLVLPAPGRGHHRWRAAPDGRHEAGGGRVHPFFGLCGRRRQCLVLPAPGRRRPPHRSSPPPPSSRKCR